MAITRPPKLLLCIWAATACADPPPSIATAESALSARPERAPFYLQFTTAETTAHKFIGLNHGDESQHYDDLDFAFYLYAGDDGLTPSVQVWESGQQRAVFGGYRPGDRFQIAVHGSTVRYVHNEVVLYTSAVAPVFPLNVDTALYGCTTEESIKDVQLTSPAGVLEPVTSWKNAVGVTVSGNNLSPTATPACSWGAHGVSSDLPASDGLLAGDGYLEVRAAELAGNKFIGLSHGDSDQHFTDIDYAIYFYGTGNAVYVYENGVFEAWGGPFSATDFFRVEVSGGAVRYSKNGAVFYTSSNAPVFPLIVDSAFYGCTTESLAGIALSEDGGAALPVRRWQNMNGMNFVAGALSATATPACTWGAHGASSLPDRNATAGGPSGDAPSWFCSNQPGAYCSNAAYPNPLRAATEVQEFMDNAAKNWGCPSSSFGGAVVAEANEEGYSKNYIPAGGTQSCGKVYWSHLAQAAYFMAPAGDKITDRYGTAPIASELGLPASNPLAYGSIGTTVQVFNQGFINYRAGDSIAYYAAGTDPERRAVIRKYLQFGHGQPLLQDLKCTSPIPGVDANCGNSLNVARTGVYLHLFDPQWGLDSYLIARDGWTEAFFRVRPDGRAVERKRLSNPAQRNALVRLQAAFPDR